MGKAIKVNEIKAELARKEMTQGELASAIGLSQSGLWKKMTGTTEFTLNEIRNIRDVLSLDNKQIVEIFLSQ